MYYKATRPDGTDFQTCTIDYDAALVSGEVIRHPVTRKVRDDASTYLSISTEPADCTGFNWPCRLFRVEPIGKVGTASDLPNKRTTRALRVVEELPAWQAFGPNGEAVALFIERCRTLTPEQTKQLAAAGDAARDAARYAAWAAAGDAARAAAGVAAGAAAGDAAWYAAGAAARYAAWDAAGDAARDAAWDAAGAAAVRDLITPEQYALLTEPFRDVGLGEWVA